MYRATRWLPAFGVVAACVGLEPAPAQEQRRVSPDPEGARLVTSDVQLFWQVYDRFRTAYRSDDTAAFGNMLETEYLARGTDGLRDFVPYRILGGKELAGKILEEPARYESIRQSSSSLLGQERAIRAAFYAMEYLYPDAVYPNVYFVIGRLNSGGTVSDRGLLIGAEMFRYADEYPPLVAHELIHFQQNAIPRDKLTLLAQSIHEGSADFLAELISGGHSNDRAHEYGLAHEAALWEEFQEDMRVLRDWNGWLYGGAPEGRPADLGYFFGYRIAEAYYDRAEDKRQAIRDIIQVTEFDSFLERSGYNPR